MLKQDYIMRLIHEMVRVILKILFHVEEQQEEIRLADENAEETLYRLVELAKQGKINEAENLLYEELDTDNREQLKMGLAFYDFINGFSEEELERAKYSREEIKFGMEVMLEKFGYGGFAEMFF